MADGSDNYRLTATGYHGTAGDSLGFYHHGHQFTTYDRDHDLNPGANCAQQYSGAWWYLACYHSNLNGRYLYAPDNLDTQGIIWGEFISNMEGLKHVVMKIKRI